MSVSEEDLIVKGSPTSCKKKYTKDIIIKMKHEAETSTKTVALHTTIVVVSYGFVSTSLAFIDKTLLNTYDFNYPYFILTCQMIFTIFLLEFLRLFGVISLSSYTFTKGWDFLIPSTCYWLNAVLSMVALSGMNIPMFGVVRRCEPLALLILAFFILKQEKPSSTVILSVVMITVGCIVAAAGDLAFESKAYICGFASIVTQAIYLTIIQLRCQSDLSTVETLQLNSYNTMPFLLAFSLYNQELTKVFEYNNYNDVMFIIIFICTVSFGCLLNYVMFLCASVTSALTTSVVGTVKSLAQTVIGLYTFGGVRMNDAAIVGMFVNLIGGFVYTYGKFKSKKYS